MTVQYDSQSMVILAIKARLLEKIPEAFENNTWIDDAPIPFGKDPPPTQHSFTLVADDGHFDPDWSGNACSLKETTTVTITHMQLLQLDDTKKLSNIIAENEKRSMLRIKHDILASLLFQEAGEVPDEEPGRHYSPWRPQSATKRYLFDSLHPTVYVSPKRHKDWPMLYQYIEFRFTFVLKL